MVATAEQHTVALSESEEGAELRALLMGYSASRQALVEELLERVLHALQSRRSSDPTLPPLSLERKLHGEIVINAPLSHFETHEDPLDLEYRSGIYQRLNSEISNLLEITVSDSVDARCTLGISRSILSLHIVIPGLLFHDPRAKMHVASEDFAKCSHAYLVFLAFLSWQNSRSPNAELLQNRRDILKYVLSNSEDLFVNTIASIYYCLPARVPHFEGLLNAATRRAHGTMLTTTGIQELDDMLREISILSRAIPVQAHIEERSIILPRLNYQASPTLKHIFEIEQASGAMATHCTRAALELFCWAAEVAQELRANSDERDLLDRIGDALHERFRFDRGDDDWAVESIISHRLNSKIAALFFLEVAHQLSLDMKLFLVVAGSEQRYFLSLQRGSLDHEEYIDPLASESDSRRIVGATNVMRRLRTGLDAHETVSTPIFFEPKALLAQHLMDLSRESYRQAVELRDRGTIQRTQEENRIYRDMIFRQQKICRTALELFADIPEAHLRLGNPERAESSAKKLAGAYARLLLEGKINI